MKINNVIVYANQDNIQGREIVNEVREYCSRIGVIFDQIPIKESCISMLVYGSDPSKNIAFQQRLVSGREEIINILKQSS